MTTPPGSTGFDWEAAGQNLGETLDDYHAIVVAGANPVTTGQVAIGIARGQAFKRRVAVGDLFAESPPIQSLVTSEDPHGLVDSFLYGVSLSRIAYEVPGSGQLFVMPSGTEPPDYNEILPNPRWTRLTAGFREVGALLVLAAPAGAPHLEDLVSVADGAVLVGDVVPRQLPMAKIIASIRKPPTESATPSSAPSSTSSASATSITPVPPIDVDLSARNTPKRHVVFLPAREPVPADVAASEPVPRTRRPRRRIAAIAGILLTLALAGIGAWLAYRPLADGPLLGPRRKVDTAAGPERSAGVFPDSAGRNATADTMPPLVVANPSDSAASSPFAVELMAANTQAGAILKLQQDSRNLPAATFAPVLIQGARWFKVIGGAYTGRPGADSLLVSLRRRHVLGDSSGSVVRLPFAFLIDSGVPVAAVPGMLATYADRGQPVYALRQSGGTAWLLAGAFESAEQSLVYAESLRASGITPVLVYRKGRLF